MILDEAQAIKSSSRSVTPVPRPLPLLFSSSHSPMGILREWHTSMYYIHKTILHNKPDSVCIGCKDRKTIETSTLYIEHSCIDSVPDAQDSVCTSHWKHMG